MNAEMQKLRDYLTAHNIPWRDDSEPNQEKIEAFGKQIEPIVRTKFELYGNEWSVVYGFGTYGYQQGLLGCWIRGYGADPDGWLTADDIIRVIEGTQ